MSHSGLFKKRKKKEKAKLLLGGGQSVEKVKYVLMLPHYIY